MTIHIEELTLSAIIGILDFERITPQKVIVDVLIDYHYEKNQFINYADITFLVKKLIENRKYELLEEALEEIIEKIISQYPQIQTLFLKISKPDIIKNAKVSLSKKIEMT